MGPCAAACYDLGVLELSSSNVLNLDRLVPDVLKAAKGCGCCEGKHVISPFAQGAKRGPYCSMLKDCELGGTGFDPTSPNSCPVKDFWHGD